MMKKIQEMLEKTIVMVTHDTSLAKYGTRVVRVEDGKKKKKGKEILK